MTKKAANLLPTLMDGDDEVVMAFDDRAVRVEQGMMSFTFLMVEGKYPNYMSVIPQDAPYSLTADRQALLNLCPYGGLEKVSDKYFYSVKDYKGEMFETPIEAAVDAVCWFKEQGII